MDTDNSSLNNDKEKIMRIIIVVIIIIIWKCSKNNSKITS